ncbi:hypothetical protein ECANGB1_467 [Enterospora canceri]|uniref:Uncharacterized protein n=1 Tax=Enterospora canceri TaxID=1081671 RepID=A0A1Y1S827_9MICR|nr:hypothetical protein ECANGB1_467 [Enterospora canceri]
MKGSIQAEGEVVAFRETPGQVVLQNVVYNSMILRVECTGCFLLYPTHLFIYEGKLLFCINTETNKIISIKENTNKLLENKTIRLSDYAEYAAEFGSEIRQIATGTNRLYILLEDAIPCYSFSGELFRRANTVTFSRPVSQIAAYDDDLIFTDSDKYVMSHCNSHSFDFRRPRLFQFNNTVYISEGSTLFLYRNRDMHSVYTSTEYINDVVVSNQGGLLIIEGNAKFLTGFSNTKKYSIAISAPVAFVGDNLFYVDSNGVLGNTMLPMMDRSLDREFRNKQVEEVKVDLMNSESDEIIRGRKTREEEPFVVGGSGLGIRKRNKDHFDVTKKGKQFTNKVSENVTNNVNTSNITTNINTDIISIQSNTIKLNPTTLLLQYNNTGYMYLIKNDISNVIHIKYHDSDMIPVEMKMDESITLGAFCGSRCILADSTRIFHNNSVKQFSGIKSVGINSKLIYIINNNLLSVINSDMDTIHEIYCTYDNILVYDHHILMWNSNQLQLMTTDLHLIHQYQISGISYVGITDDKLYVKSGNNLFVGNGGVLYLIKSISETVLGVIDGYAVVRKSNSDDINSVEYIELGENTKKGRNMEDVEDVISLCEKYSMENKTVENNENKVVKKKIDPNEW